MKSKLILFGLVMVLMSCFVSGYTPDSTLDESLTEDILYYLPWDNASNPTTLVDSTGNLTLSKSGTAISSSDSHGCEWYDG